MTLSRNIENPGIVRTVYSGIFRHIQGHSAIKSYVQTYCSIFRHYWGVRRHYQTYSELCITLAYTTVPYLEPWLIQNPSHLQKSVKHVRYDHANSGPQHSQNSLFRQFQGYLGIFRDIDAYSAPLSGTKGEMGRLPCLF